jgi:hypothetical protein
MVLIPENGLNFVTLFVFRTTVNFYSFRNTTVENLYKKTRNCF